MKRWTEQDMKQIKRMVRQGLPAKAIAKKLGRTLGALYVKASGEGVSLKK
jgi:hypothetical protein